MLPPKKEDEAAHLPYQDTFAAQKSVANFDKDFRSPSPDKQAPECPEEPQPLQQDSCDPPGSPEGDTSTSLVIIDSDPVSDPLDKPASSPMEILKNLETVKTPEPSEMDNSIVRASFVDFSNDEEVPQTSHSHQFHQRRVEEEDDESKEFSLTLNPDLPKIRAQQIQNWLEFEKDQEDLSTDLNNNLTSDSDSSSILGDSIDKPVGNLSQDFDMDSLSEAGQLNPLTEDADGMSRRVRFLTDPEGNILISVYLTKLVQIILSILKLVTAGYLDFTSHKSNPPSSSSAETLETFGLSSSASASSANSESEYPCPYEDETDSISIISGEGEEFLQHQVIPQAQTNGHEGHPIPQVIEPQQTEGLEFETNVQVSGNPEKSEEDIEEPGKDASEQIGNPDIGLEPPVRVINEVKKVISVEPSLRDFDDGEEDVGSDTETMSTSSCSSMIEVIPKEKQKGDLTYNNEGHDGDNDTNPDGLDGNNNELKTDMGYLEDPEIKDKSITCYEFQPEKEAITSGTHPSADDDDQMATEAEGTDKPLLAKDFEKRETTLTALSVLNGHKTSGEVASSQHMEVQSEERKPTVDLLKFNPIIEQERNHAKYHNNISLVDINNNSYEDNNETVEGHYHHHQQHDQDMYDEQDPEKQLVSLCIEEEPISAVALTIAKWESFSKKQKQMEQSERSNIIIKGKVNVQSYTNNANHNNKNNNNPTPTATYTNNNVAPNYQTNSQGKVMSPNYSSLGKTFQLPSPSSSSSRINNNNNNPHMNNNNNNNNKTPPGWNCWTNNKSNESKSLPEDDEAIYAQPNSQAGSITTSLANPSAILRAYPKPNSKGEIINWFKEGEMHRSGILLSYGQTNHHAHPVGAHQGVTSPVIVSWFFGLITRQQAEELLHGQPTGTFLLRISSRIWGYTLSYQANNKSKHFLISAINPAVPTTLTAGTEGMMEGHGGASGNSGGKKQLLFPFSPGGRYSFIGTNMTPYTTLTSLIRHHSHAPITKAGGEKLVIPCPGGPKIAGIEYVFK